MSSKNKGTTKGDNVAVVIRCRPQNKRETKRGEGIIVTTNTVASEVVVQHPQRNQRDDGKRRFMGKTMEEWLRFGVCFWHTFRGKGSDPFGAPTMTRPWDDETDTLENAETKQKKLTCEKC